MNSLKKTQESWNAYTPVSKELLKQTEDVLDAFLHEKREEIEMQTNKFHKTFHAEKSEDENIYLCYLKQSVRYLEILLDDTSLEEDDAGVPSENGELEVDEYDTSYCASLMWNVSGPGSRRDNQKKTAGRVLGVVHKGSCQFVR